MSFVDYYGRPYMQGTRQEQFVKYLNDTGASKAIQDALILLYRMPIKPSNLTKFFAEYFENGAKSAVSLSLLRAELCYKHSQTQSMHKRLAFLEEQIKQLSPKDSSLIKVSEANLDNNNDKQDENNVPGHENFRLTLEGTSGGIQDHMLSRFLNDLDGAVRGSVADTSVSGSHASLAGKESYLSFLARQESLISLDDADQYRRPIIEDDSTLSVYSQTGIFQEQCTHEMEKDPFKSYQEDVKRLDPWGIVCRIPKRNAPNPSHNKPGDSGPKADVLFQELSKPDLHVDLSVVSDHRSSAESELEYKNYDSDDLETLAEIYQNQAVIEEILEIPEDPKKAKILSVLTPLDHSHLTDILGWRPMSTKIGQSKNNQSQQPKPSCKPTTVDYCAKKKIKKCKQRNVFWPFENSYSGESPFKPTIDDSFLLKTNKGGGVRGGWGDNAEEHQDFMSEFYNRHSTPSAKEMETICEKCCRLTRISVNKEGKPIQLRESHGKLMRDEETMTLPAGDCPCPPNKCNCDDECVPIEGSQAFGSHGTMSNWTRYSKEYPECMPPEDYDPGEGETPGEVYDRCVRAHKAAKKSAALQQKFNEDFAIPLSPVKSSCLCNDSMTDIPPDILNQCAEFYRQQNLEAQAEVETGEDNQEGPKIKDDDKHAAEYANRSTLTCKSDQVLYDMIKAQRRKSMEQKEAELAKVFQDPDVYESKKQSIGPAGDGENVAQEIRNSAVPKRGSDAYELDLDKEVRKTLGF